MTKHDGFQCDGGCGASLVLDPTDSTTRHGWYRTYSPARLPTLDCCSAICLVRALDRLGVTDQTGLPHGSGE